MFNQRIPERTFANRLKDAIEYYDICKYNRKIHGNQEMKKYNKLKLKHV